MNKYYITFGSNHVPGINSYYVIEAKDAEEARLEAFNRFGNGWAFMYNEEQWNEGGISQAEKYRLRQIV